LISNAAPTDDYGFAVAPRAQIVRDQPIGDSIQYEHEVASGGVFASSGYAVRQVDLPPGAAALQSPAIAAPSLLRQREISVVASGPRMTMLIDGRIALQRPTFNFCGGVFIRVWNATLSITDLRVS
jgi:hypothetical protein